MKSLFRGQQAALPLLCLFVLAACQPGNQPAKLETGVWRATFSMQEQTLPFNLEVQQDASGQYQAFLLNDSERILIDEMTVEGDSVRMPMHIFDGALLAKIQQDGRMAGHFVNYSRGERRGEYTLPFEATPNTSSRFEPVAEGKVADVSGRWAVTFDHEGEITEAVGVFKQQGPKVTGTFLTATGDYRYLEGQATAQGLALSCFDGEHAFLFTAALNEEGQLAGDFFSGSHWHENWSATRDPEAALPDPESLTFLKEGYDKLAFSFPNVSGESVSLTDEKYQGKVVVVQLFGTWCPNCWDETRFLSEWYGKNKDRGVEVVALSYERKADFDYAAARINRMREKVGANYDFLVAGTSDKAEAAKTLPMLNAVLAFPTTIFVDQQGRVRKIHTGFSGPGTGDLYTQFVEQFNLTIDKLLAEEEQGS